MSLELMKITNLSDFKELERRFTERWLDLEQNSNAFRYKLNVKKQKNLDGKLHFLLQLNTERTILRRAPQQITSIIQPFDGNLFNFNKVNDCEVILRCQSQLNDDQSNGITTFLVNNSPLTKYHSLVCPRLNENLPQVITNECIVFAIDLLIGLNDRSYRIGYNSLRAFASVNHLHLHLLHVPEKLYIEDTKITLISNDIYRLDLPTFAFCLPVFRSSDNGTVAVKLMKIIEYFCRESIPHNIFWTFGTHSGQELVKIFIYPRSRLTDKPNSTFNVAFCELSGYVPVGDADVYDNLTEDFLIGKITEAMGPIDRERIVADTMKLITLDTVSVH